LKKYLSRTVGVLMGGTSAEREVSLKSGRACADALKRRGYRVFEIDAGDDVAERLRLVAADVAFIALHGRPGEDGTVQGLLEVMRIPYTGSGVLASALGMDKVASRALFLQNGIPCPAGISMTRNESLPLAVPLDFPVVVKPAAAGSSLGVTLVPHPREIPAAAAAAFQYGPRIVIETYIPGREVQVGILDNIALGVIEIRSKSAFYDYTAKYVPGMSAHLFPAPLSKPVYQNVMEIGLRAHRVLGCRGATRVDLRLTDDGLPFVLEINTLPGMTETSLLPEIARGVGIDFDTLVERILDAAILETAE